jgi:predicted TPR repeat methyltransferase
VPADARLDILDIGCGTGPDGRRPALRSRRKTLTGVSISSIQNMLEQARRRGIYDRLIESGYRGLSCLVYGRPINST